MRINKKGFTLIELVISIAIIAIIFAGIMVGIQFAMRTTFINRHRTEATILAQRNLEGIKGNGFENITAQNYTANGVLGETEVIVEDVTEDAKVIGKEVTVSVRWADFRRTYTERVTSFIRDPSL